MNRKPYQTDDSGKYWDYSLKIKGVIYEASVNKSSGVLAITEDQDQEKPYNEFKKLKDFAKSKGIKNVLLRLKYLVALEDYLADNYPEVYDSAVTFLEDKGL